MALPTVIATDGLGTVGCAGPYVSSTGNVYVVIVDDERFDLRALKATDPTSSFAGVGTDVVIGAGGDIIQSISGRQAADVIHLITKNSNGSDPVDIRYHTFDMATDAWVITNEMVKTDMVLQPSGLGWRCPIDMVVRTDGSIICVYNGPTETVAAVVYDRVYYARRIAGTWSADIALGPSGVTASWVGGSVVLGALDRAHFFFSDYTNNDLYHRTLNSSYSLDTLGSAFDGDITDPETAYAQRGAHVTATGIVSQPWYDNFEILNRGVATSVDAPSWVNQGDITGARSVLSSPMKYVASHAVDGTNLWNIFIDGFNDIYTQSNPNGAGWSVPTGFLVTDASAIYANVYTRGSALVIGMVYHSTDPTYHELTLSAIGVVSSGSPNGFLLMGVGR